MINTVELEQWVEKIVEQFHPIRVILFGSYASNSAQAHSDVDLLIIMSYEGRPFQIAAKIRRALRQTMGYMGALDILVRSPEELQRRLAMKDSFLQAIVENGKTLYDVNT